jgi:arsenate reductase
MKHVLFVCTHNAGRSEMAEAFFNRSAPEDVRAESAGDAPSRQIWPEVITAMREVGIPVRFFVLTVAARQARDCLARDACAVPA